ncbi:MAG: outer membrane beta-barrel protein [Candidatus Krumholzibacteriia bacterium]
MKRIITLSIVVLVSLAMAAPSLGFDGDRQGFMLNLGAGFGQAKQTASASGVEVSLDATGFGGDFKIGGGVNPQMLIYYTNRTLFHTMEVTYTDPFLGPTTLEADYINGMSAVGVSYFLEPEAPSFFFSGGLGLGVLMDSEADESESGVGFTAGVGYEFARNWIIEGTYMNAKVFEEMGMEVSISNLMVTISWLAY